MLEKNPAMANCNHRLGHGDGGQIAPRALSSAISAVNHGREKITSQSPADHKLVAPMKLRPELAG